ncbi:DNA/RNA non-specific endonuclease [Undibacterium danionis]|uniref:DNA/RNA non-specific endonuclease n=1 Tax=Undibacterium danionis TaxID=1812100 RepID=A0ABV6IE97_9BURK
MPHEAWHVVQQAQGRVKPTMQLKSGNVINDDLSLEAEADKMGAQAATMQSSQNTTQLLSYRPSGAAMPMQLSYKFGDKTWAEDDRKLESSLFKDEGSDGKFTGVKADTGLPTAYGVLSSIFRKNLNSDVFKSTSSLSSNCDRPHSVAASLERSQNREERGSEDADIVSAIGNLGDEEFMIRNGASSKRAATYHGGHLVGNQILGGDASNVAWNVAPQDANNNQFAYNNTIERMLRDATPGTQYSYEVKVAYRSLNYRVNQQMLLDNQIINKLDPSTFWEIQIPARIPQLWEATATMSNQGEFASPAKAEGTTYDQLSQNLESELDEEDNTHTARYKLGFQGKDGDELALKDVKKDASEVKKISFSMHQVLPSDLDSQPPPKGWGTNVDTDFGEVKLEQLTVEKVEKLLSEIKKQYEEIDFSESEDDIEIKDEDFPKILSSFQFGSSSDLAFQIHCGDKLISEFEKYNYFSAHKRYCQEFEIERNELTLLKTNLQKEGEILEEIENEDLTIFDQNELLQKKRKLEKLEVGSRTYEDKKKNVKSKKQKIIDNRNDLKLVCEEIRSGEVTREKKRNIQSLLQKRTFRELDLVSLGGKILEIKPTETKY